jgi:phthiocerol/phenolphthiocerol synthesis type-I polyketide synthase E
MNSNTDKIAVIGMACRFPGAKNLNEYWNNLVEGKDTITHFRDEELSKFEINYEELKKNPDYIKARGILEDIDKFDAGFFEMTPKEAAGTDPQQRVWLEIAWEAFENAGCDPFNYPGAIGVFAGGYLNTYLLNNILRDPVKLENYIRLRTTESFQIMTGNDVAYIPTKTAYKFNLKGPAINIQTACSTSLVAISQACQSLFSFESDLCLAGGICIVTPQESGYIYQEGAIPSPDGKCRPFDAKAKGSVFSNGVGIVILKRLEDAIRDHDNIYSLVSGWAVNNDGSNKVSYTAPSIEGQAEVIMMAQAFAGISPEEISYIEAHGTATQLGDPIELAALTKAFSSKTERKQFCGIGSVKSNIGHTDAAAGVASFIKACLATYYKMLPATLHFNEPNPHFDFEKSPFYVQDKLKKWNEDKPLIMGVSSFGIGGTNAHVILEEPPLVKQKIDNIKLWPEFLPLSAKSGIALKDRIRDFLDYLKKEPNAKLEDIAFTLQNGRNHMQYRSYCVAEKIDEIKLNKIYFFDITSCTNLSEITFMFPGQGAQYVNMGQTLYKTNDQFKNILDKCFDIVKSETGLILKEILFSTEDIELAEKKLARTDITQMTLFIIEYALAKIYEELGIQPKYLIGHSIGEYTAACISGVFDLDTALKIVIKRGQLMQSMPSGSMLAVKCNKEKLEALNNSKYEIAADNAHELCSISFMTEDIELIKSLLDKNDIGYVPINTSHAFHSSVFDPILKEFGDYVNKFKLNIPVIPFISCLTGEFITPAQAVSYDYWSQQLRCTVLFKKGVSTIKQHEDVLFLEVGPNTHLSSLIRRNTEVSNKNAIVASLGKKDVIDDRFKIISSLGNLWVNGTELKFERLHLTDQPIKICLPTYPFQRQRYWIDYVPGLLPVNAENPYTEISSERSEKLTIQSSDDSLVEELKDLLCQMTGFIKENLKEDMSFEKMGLDSLFLTQLSRSLEKKYMVRVEFRQLTSEYSSLKELSKLILGKSNHLIKQRIADNREVPIEINNFVKFQPNGNKPPLVIIHGQQANNLIQEFIDDEQPFYGYLHPGSDGEKISFKSVNEMAKAYLGQLLRHRPEGPYYLGGFSFGGILAFEMAIQLRNLGQEVPLLALIDSASPLAREPFRWYNNFFKIIKSNILVPPVIWILRIVKLSICKSFIKIKKPVPINLRPFYIIDKYKMLTRTYQPKKFDGDILLFRASQNKSSFKYLGWERFANNIKIVNIDGDHLKVIKDKKRVKILFTEIEKYLL